MAGGRGFTMVSMLNTRWRNCIHKTQKKYHITNSIMNGFRCKIIQRKQMEEEKRSKDIIESQTNIDVNCIIPSSKWWIGYKSVNRQKNRTWQKRLLINWYASYRHALAIITMWILMAFTRTQKNPQINFSDLYHRRHKYVTSLHKLSLQPY